MRTRRLPAIIVALSLCAVALLAGCGVGTPPSVMEGAPLKLGGVEYNVLITRYLNPNDIEDHAYLQGAPKLPINESYLGVFMQIKNTSDQATTVPAGMKVVDTAGKQYDPAPLKNPFALPLGAQVQGNGVVPDPESPAANGPTQGSMALFLITASSIENRPLELVIPAAHGTSGEIQLDL